MNITTPLMSHQNAAVDKLARLRVGALFMEMGTGKTLTAMQLIALRQAKISRVLWFCPVSLKDSTREEIWKHAPDTAIHIFDDKTCLKTMPTAFIHLIGIESMSLSDRVILSVAALADARSFVIVDESSYIKGHNASRTKWITRVAERARYRMLLTGTPISQGVVDLFAQMRFLSPEILGYKSFYSFARNHLEYSDKYKGLIVRSHNTGLIAAKIAPYVYQVKKDECLDLPSKCSSGRHYKMTPEQRELYEQAKDELLLQIEGRDIESRDIFRLFTALQQITCGFWNKIEHSGRGKTYKRTAETLDVEHNRLDVLRATLGGIAPERQVIIWTKYRRCIGEISALLQHEFDDTPAQFYGDLSTPQRTAQLERFRHGNTRFFVATPSCGGHGLTLNEATYSIFYTDGFKYSERIQAEDRNHRIGQRERVTYISLVCLDSIDERIQKALASKGNAVAQFRDQVQKLRDKKSLRAAIKAL